MLPSGENIRQITAVTLTEPVNKRSMSCPCAVREGAATVCQAYSAVPQGGTLREVEPPYVALKRAPVRCSASRGRYFLHFEPEER